MAKRPSLCIFHGWALVIAFKKDNLPAANMRLEQAEACLSDIDPQAQSHLVIGAPPVPLQAWVTGQITLLRSFILMMASRKQANPQALVDLGQLAYDRLPADDVPARSAALLDICYASQARGDAEEAEKKFEKTAVIALSGGNYFGAVIAEYHRAHGLHVQGKLREVIDFCNEKKKAYGAYFHDPIKEMPAIALLDQAIGYALLEMNELDEAEAYLSGGLEVGQWMPREELTGYLALARLYAGKGDLAAMTETLRRLEMRWPDVRYCTEAMRRLNDIKSRPEDAETRAAAFKWAAEYPPEIGPDVVVPGIGPAWNDEADYAVFSAWAQIQIILGHTGAALAVLQPLLNAALDHGLVHRQIELSLLLAQAFYVQNDKEQAWKLLSDALAHAEPAGYMRLVDQGYILIRMLIEARKLGIAPQYIKRCLEIAPSMALQPSQISSAHPSLDKTTAPSNGLIEPLSSREIEVLVLMSEGLSNAQIAARLYLSPNTLKAHTQNIFGKLDVHNRVQAVNRAHELKII